jgi:hypothetical protein
VAGITVGLILVTLDGIAAKQLAEAWATAPSGERAAALRLLLWLVDMNVLVLRRAASLERAAAAQG